MGLDTTHNAWHGSYGNFSRWRQFIATRIGIKNLDDMLGFGGSKEFDKKEPLTALLNHSDCDGELTPKECAGIARRLRELLPDITGDDEETEYMRDKTIQFAEGCELAAKKKEKILFR